MKLPKKEMLEMFLKSYKDFLKGNDFTLFSEDGIKELITKTEKELKCL